MLKFRRLVPRIYDTPTAEVCTDKGCNDTARDVARTSEEDRTQERVRSGLELSDKSGDKGREHRGD